MVRDAYQQVLAALTQELADGLADPATFDTLVTDLRMEADRLARAPFAKRMGRGADSMRRASWPISSGDHLSGV
jgi:hypothetical protein